MSVWVVVVAAGRGERFGGPKHEVVLAGRPVVAWSLDAARAVADGIVLVVPAGTEAVAVGADVVVTGGERRSDSVRAGLAAVPPDTEVIVVHDAARPAASRSLFVAVVAAVRGGADGAVPGVPLVDTVKEVRDGVVVTTPDRAAMVAVQTPQAFASAPLRAAHLGRHDAADDATLVELAGGKVVVVPGETANRKLTTADDVAALEAVLA